jgi:hypothetical protein
MYKDKIIECPTGGTSAVQALFPHRSRNCIKVIAHRRCIKVADLPAFKSQNTAHALTFRTAGKWQLWEDRLIQLCYGTMPIEEPMAQLPGRTEHAIRVRAVNIDASRAHAPACRAKWAAERESA